MRRSVLSLVAALLLALPAPAGGAAVAAVDRSDGPVVELPGELTAGTGLPVTVTGVDGTVTLTVIGSLGTVVRTAATTGGAATFALESALSQAAGTLTVIAESGGRSATGSVAVLPGPAVGPLLPVVGARSIVADAADRSMVVALPVDRWGNAVAEGSAVTVVHRDPTGTTSTGSTEVRHLLGWLELTSGTVAGRGAVWLRTGPDDTVTGQQVSLDEVAGPPLPFTLAAVDPTLPARLGADGQALVTVRTSVLADRFGNVQPDGTLVTVEWEGPGGRSRSSAVTISGVAELSVQAPTAPGTVTLTAFSRGTSTAAPLTLDFPSVVATVPVDIAADERGLVVTVGPVNRTGGTFVPDGTVATVTLSDLRRNDVQASVGLVDGSGTVSLPVAALSGPVTAAVTVLGTTTTVDVG
ncbi:hypothetical protein [Nakamurella deserti]|uniref:hypothetical protein n=1 Tax=Nakamurella deserti TaxID=2164074 RepID=UPI000DBE14A7|nr:hypothetical protein [Nakamurella deserti]